LALDSFTETFEDYMVDFINEVEEELRKDQYNALLKKWGPLLGAAAVALVLGTAAYQYLDSRNERLAKSASISYFDAYDKFDAGETDAAKAEFIAISDAARPGYAGLSLMQAAGIALDKGDAAEAVRLFDEAAAKFSHPRHVHLAKLKAAYILMDQGQYDDVNTRIMPLIESGAPYEHLAQELAGFVALEQGDTRTARSKFALLARGVDVSPGVQNRAEQMLSITPALQAEPEQDTNTETPETGEDEDIKAPTPASPDTEEP